MIKRISLLVVVLFWAAGAFAQVSQIFVAGETLDFDLSWSRLSGGTARMTISRLNDARFRLTSVGRSSAFFSRIFRVRDEIESIVSRETFSTLEYHKNLDERGRRKDELTTIDESRRVATRKGKMIEVPKPVFDPLSLIYHIRTLDLSPGKTHEFPVIADGKLYTLRASVMKRETITVPAGTFAAVVVEPKMASEAGVFRDEQRSMLVWYSDDERHIPLRIRSELKFGSITAALRSVSSSVEGTEPPAR